MKWCAFSGAVIRPFYEAYTANVDAAYSKFDCLGLTGEDNGKTACSVFTPPLH